MINLNVFGHRGASMLEPENTFRSFKRAFQDGAHGIEFDVRLTKDKELVVIHDETIKRTSNGIGEVNNLSFVELLKFNFGKGEKIPLLKDVLKIYGNQRWLIIEVKQANCEKQINDLFIDLRINKKIILSSFNIETLKCFNLINHEIPLAYIYSSKNIDVYDIKKYTFLESIHPHNELINEKLIKIAHTLGLLIRGWVINDGEKAQELATQGIDGIFSDNPGLIIKNLNIG